LQHKENFKELDAAESQRLMRGQKDHLDYEIRKFRRRRLVKYHDLEQDLLREVRTKRNVIDFFVKKLYFQILDIQ
jgi:thousand and one amino acid protein kinase